MYGEKMSEKNIFPSLRREIHILYKIRNIEGCVKFIDILTDEKSLSIVFPYYHMGDLYKFSCPTSKPAKEWQGQKVCYQLASTLL
jgi:serine/threonine protein kinase